MTTNFVRLNLRQREQAVGLRKPYVVNPVLALPEIFCAERAINSVRTPRRRSVTARHPPLSTRQEARKAMHRSSWEEASLYAVL